MKKRGVMLALAMGLACSGQAARKAPAAKGGNSPLTKAQGDAILEELRQIRKMLELERPLPQQPDPTPARIEVKLSSSERSLGDPKAPITMVEFTDYQCPFCKQFHEKVFPALKTEFIDTGKLRFVTRDLPLDFHPYARGSAEGARCAAEQNKFWAMRERIFAQSPKIAEADLIDAARDLGLNQELFRSCLSSHKHEVDVRLGLAEAASLKISGTPSFVVGLSKGDRVEGQFIEGTMPFADLKQLVEILLNQKK
jgi:protein-disulfide isomerase